MLGHEIVGEVVSGGEGAGAFAAGDRVGVPWLAWTCGVCRFCRAGRENLCDRARFTGYQVDGGYAEYTVADARFCFPLPEGYTDAEAAPLLCAGLIGHRALRAAGGEAERLGIYGFGAAAHIVAQVAEARGPPDLRLHPLRRRRGTGVRPRAGRGVGRRLDGAAAGAARRGDHLRAGGRPGAGGAGRGGEGGRGGVRRHPHEPDSLVSLRSPVGRANGPVGRQPHPPGWGGFLALAGRVPLQIATEPLALEHANEGLDRLRRGQVRGAAVLTPIQPAVG